MKKIPTLLVASFLYGCSLNNQSSSFHQQLIVDKIYHIKNNINLKIKKIEKNQNISTKEFREISNYKPIKKDILFENKNYTAIREFYSKGIKYYLAVDLETNKTQIILAKKSRDFPNNSSFEKSNYFKALNYLKHKTGIQNTGLKNDIKFNKNTVYMTVDFCPSSKRGFEKDFFENFIKKGYKNIAIAITGSWIKKHEKSFQWLIEQKSKHNLNIVWVNHTFNHKYDWGEPIKNNFLLKQNTNLEKEILELEKMLIKNKQTPSIFMRFPGLVSDDKIREKVINKYSLIFIGSDAWLAKGEIPKNGSFILIHGNKNEPLGIKKANRYLEKKNHEIKFGNLNESI